MTGGGLPRFAHKDVRAAAKRLVEHGWVYESDDASGHALFTHPSGGRVSLPGTPKGSGWWRAVDRAIRDADGTPAPKSRRRVKHLPRAVRVRDDATTTRTIRDLRARWDDARAALDAATTQAERIAAARHLLAVEDDLDRHAQPPPAGRWLRDL